jgi:L-fuculose-phosphate aldolase
MDEWRARETLCEIGRRVYQRGFVAANDGNFSCRLEKGIFLATPTMVSKGFMKPEDLVRVDCEGHPLEEGKRVTSELKMHLTIYHKRPDVGAVVHTHPPHATAFAVAGKPVPKCVLPEVEVLLGEVPTAPYVLSGGQELADALLPFLADYQVVLLQNHGAVTMGSDPLTAYYRMEVLDQYCRILILTEHLGGVRPLPQDEMERLMQMKSKLGLPDRRQGNPAALSCASPPPTPEPKTPQQSLLDSGGQQQSLTEDELAQIVREVIKELRG